MNGERVMSPEQQYVDSVKDVIEALKETRAGGEVIMTLASIWAQAKASELTTLNVVREQMEDQRGDVGDIFQNLGGFAQHFEQFMADRE